MIYTLTQAADAIRRFPGRMEVLDTIPTGETSGIVLSRRPDSPGVLGLSAVDASGEVTALGLSVEEARKLRDALNDWLYDETGFRQD